MNRYGQAITWSAVTAPHLFSGDCTAYSYDDGLSEQLVADEAGDQRAVVLHSSKAELSFDARITKDSTDFLNLATGAALEVDDLETGVVLCRRAVERWTLMQPKTASIQATHFLDMVQADPTAAGVDLTAITPDQTGLGILYPGSEIIFSTYGMTHASGVIHMLEIAQELSITEDEPSPDGKILGAASHGYLRRISLDLLSTGAAPAKGSVLTITNAPAHAGGYRITNVGTKFSELRGKMYSLRAVWIPAFV